MNFFKLRHNVYMCIFVCTNKQPQLSLDLAEIPSSGLKVNKPLQWYTSFQNDISLQPLNLITWPRDHLHSQEPALSITPPKLSDIPTQFSATSHLVQNSQTLQGFFQSLYTSRQSLSIMYICIMHGHSPYLRTLNCTTSSSVNS